MQLTGKVGARNKKTAPDSERRRECFVKKLLLLLCLSAVVVCCSLRSLRHNRTCTPAPPLVPWLALPLVPRLALPLVPRLPLPPLPLLARCQYRRSELMLRYLGGYPGAYRLGVWGVGPCAALVALCRKRYPKVIRAPFFRAASFPGWGYFFLGRGPGLSYCPNFVGTPSMRSSEKLTF